MIFPSYLSELSIVGIFDRGIPNQERIVLCVNEGIAMGKYGLMLGIRSANGSAIPIRDNLLWFGDAWLNKGDWVFVYTGPGEPRATAVPNNTENLYSVHWGREKVILTSPEVVPILFRIDAVLVPNEGTTLLPSS